MIPKRPSQVSAPKNTIRMGQGNKAPQAARLRTTRPHLPKNSPRMASDEASEASSLHVAEPQEALAAEEYDTQVAETVAPELDGETEHAPTAQPFSHTHGGESDLRKLEETLRDLGFEDPSEASSSRDEADEIAQIEVSEGAAPHAKTPLSPMTDGSELGVSNKNFSSSYKPERIGLTTLGSPEQMIEKLQQVGYHCHPFYAAQMSLLFNTTSATVRSLLLEGPPGCGKSFMAKSLAKISGAELMCLSCFRGMNLQNLIESPSTLALASAMTGKGGATAEEIMNLGILSKAFLASQSRPVILLIDEIDKVDPAIDTFFLGPIQDARIWLESRPPIDANIDNLLIVFTKNFERPLNDALLRRIQPVRMQYMDSSLEVAVLSPHCPTRLVENLVRIADIMRESDGSYPFERPPAPEELLKVGKFVMQLLEWKQSDFAFVGWNVWYMMAKSEHDRSVLELMLRYHPEFFDPLVPDGRKATIEQVYARLGRVVLEGIVDDPDAERRGKAYRPEVVGLTKVGSPQDLARKLKAVGYECLPFNATQISLLLNTPSDRVRSLLLEGPSGCGKSFMAKCLAKITGAEFMCLSCYKDMNIQHLIEVPSALAIAQSMAGNQGGAKEKLMNLGVISRAFMKSQNQPVILLVDEIDKVDTAIDTFFLGPIQDARIWMESRPPLDANIDNLLIIFTKNYARTLNDALLRRVHPVRMTYLNATLERNILSKHCMPQLVANLVSVADRMRDSAGSYQFERPPAPEELLTGGHYIMKLLEWGSNDFAWIGRNVWAILAKSEHDRAVLEHMMRFHPDFMDPLCPDGRNAPIEQVYSRLGRVVLKDIVSDPEALAREKAWEEIEYN